MESTPLFHSPCKKFNFFHFLTPIILISFSIFSCLLSLSMSLSEFIMHILKFISFGLHLPSIFFLSQIKFFEKYGWRVDAKHIFKRRVDFQSYFCVLNTHEWNSSQWDLTPYVSGHFFYHSFSGLKFVKQRYLWKCENKSGQVSYNCNLKLLWNLR